MNQTNANAGPGFTPGPWNVRPPTRQNPSRAVVSALSGGVTIYDAPLTTETKANAHLIAASPTMFEALGIARAQVAMEPHSIGRDRTINAIDAALALACGGAK